MSFPQENYHYITIHEIKKEAAKFFHLEPKDFESKYGGRKITRPRQIAMYLTKNLTPFGYTEIARKFGGRDHSTVIHACKLVVSLMEQDPDLRKNIEILRGQIQGYSRKTYQTQLILPFAEIEVTKALLASCINQAARGSCGGAIQVAEDEWDGIQLTLFFMEEKKPARIESLVPFTPPPPRRLTHQDVIQLVADHYEVNPKVLSSPAQDEYLQYCAEVFKRLQARLEVVGHCRFLGILPGNDSGPAYFLKNDQLMSRDVEMLWGRLNPA